ncbi:hypothetical protein vseg_003840 [Gypsophila vaccaria]
MRWVVELWGLFWAAMAMIILSPSLHSFPPAEAIRSSTSFSSFRRSPVFLNSPVSPVSRVCDPNLIHLAITLDTHYLRGSIAAVHSILRHSTSPTNIFFHFISDSSDSTPLLDTLVLSVFPTLSFKLHYFNPNIVRPLISTSIRHALQHPLNYARNYLPHIVDPCVGRLIYLDSDILVVDDVSLLWNTSLGPHTLGAPQYCHANFTNYFTPLFWSNPKFYSAFSGRAPCYFNTGVMLLDLLKWRANGYTTRIEAWMDIQRIHRIYQLGSLPPFLLVFAGHVAPIDHRWNQHGLGGDNVGGSCRDLHPGPVSLLHWSGSGKPWARLDARKPCPVDLLWAPYDLYVHSTRR